MRIDFDALAALDLSAEDRPSEVELVPAMTAISRGLQIPILIETAATGPRRLIRGRALVEAARRMKTPSMPAIELSPMDDVCRRAHVRAFDLFVASRYGADSTGLFAGLVAGFEGMQKDLPTMKGARATLKELSDLGRRPV